MRALPFQVKYWTRQFLNQPEKDKVIISMLLIGYYLSCSP